jgi:hypothetical protein
MHRNIRNGHAQATVKLRRIRSHRASLEDGEAIKDEGGYEKESNIYVCDKYAGCDKVVFVITDSDPI